MCQECVDRGLITAEQNARMMAGEDPGKVLTAEQIHEVFSAYNDAEPQVMVVDGDDLKGAPDFIKALFGDKEEASPEDKAREHMDGAVELSLAFIRQKLASLEKAAKVDGAVDEPLADPRVMDRFLENLAGEVMFKMTPASIAYCYTLLAKRYNDLLAQWADLYVNDDGEIGVKVETPEAETAISDVLLNRVTAPEGDGNTGFYI